MKALYLLICVAVMALLALAASAQSKIFDLMSQSFSPKTIVLPALNLNSKILLTDTQGHAHAVSNEKSRRILSEINTLRTQPWMKSDGKTFVTGFSFEIKPSEGEKLQFVLSRQYISQWRNYRYSNGGEFFLKIDINEHTELKELFEQSK